jgi:hypothetical protein
VKDRPRWKGARCQGTGGSRAATKVFDTKVQVNYLSPRYKLDMLSENQITSQGLLLLGRVIPEEKGLPQFTIRWDEKSNHLNVDIMPEEECWQSETNGYKGHEPARMAQYPGRAFSLIIKTPKLDVIDAVIFFALTREVCVTDSLGLSDSESHN